MPLQATSGAASYDAFGGGVAAVPNYIEDVFSTYLYTGNGSTQTITNGIDLASKGGMVITKARSIAYGNILVDTTRGVNNALQTSTTNPSYDTPTAVTGVSTTGFSVGSYSNTNGNGQTFASWTFREQPKFFDVVTWTGNGASTRTISHSLGSEPGCVISKITSTTNDWYVYHRSLTSADYALLLNLTSPEQAGSGYTGATPTAPTATEFTVGGSSTNANGATYVAYLFAHNAGGFGLTGTDNVISCGSYTGNGSTTGPTITLGYESQWVMVKNTTTTGTSWRMFDTMRGFTTDGVDNALAANSSAAETVYTAVAPTSTGFRLTGITSDPNRNGDNYIYIAIRRGPMKVPTSGTSVFAPLALANSVNTQNVTGFPIDLQIRKARSVVYGNPVYDRLRGMSSVPSSTSINMGPQLFSNATSAEAPSDDAGYLYDNTSWRTGQNWTGSTAYWNFGRAPSFFDEVCYTGTGTNNRAITHNLGVVPELVIVKLRSAADAWRVYHTATGTGAYVLLNSTSGKVTNADAFPNVSSTTFTPTANESSFSANASGGTYVTYLFATCAGVSKVGSYTGTGTTKQVDCGFIAGARFVLIKRTDASADWYVWDTARGIVSGNDPYLLLNKTDAEVTNTDYVDTYSAGFEISSTAPAAINASGGTFIFLAIA